MNVLVTCGGGFQGMTIHKELCAIKNVRTFLIDINLENCSKYFFDYSDVCPPVRNEVEYIDFLFNHCKKNKIEFIIPATAYDLLILAKLKGKFLLELNCKIVVPDESELNTLLDKKKTNEFLNKNEILVQTILNPNDAKSYPIIGKPLSGCGGKGVYTFKKLEDFLTAKIENIENYLWTKYWEDFEEYSVDFSINENGDVTLPIVRIRSFVSGGFAVVSENMIDVNDELNTEIKKIVKLFGSKSYFGVHNIQIISKGKECFVSDVNPRMGTSAVFGNVLKNNLLNHIINKDHQKEVSGQFKYVRFLEERYYKKLQLKNIKAIVFDLDDTLISNKKFILERCKILFNKYEKIFGNKDLFLLNVISMLNEGKAPFLIDEICNLYDVVNLKSEILSSYQNSFPDSLFCYPDVEPTLMKLVSNNYKLFILTDNPIKTQQNKIKFFPFIQFFEKVYYTDEIKFPKPSANAFNLIKSEYGFSNDEMVMVGDNIHRDCIGAIDAGYRYSFLIRRSNGMIGNFEETGNHYNNFERIIEIKSLNDLSTYFN
jgi:HAD superfamily hydrolase (TIGR01549 family)